MKKELTAEKAEKNFRNMIFFFMGIGFTGIGMTLLVYHLNGYFSFNKDLDHNVIGSFGSFIGGFWGIFFLIATTLLVYRTYGSQKDELELTRKLLRIQLFESNYFNTITILNGVINNTSGIIYRAGDISFYGQNFYSKIIYLLKYDGESPESKAFKSSNKENEVDIFGYFIF